jgi:hypothetical protein
MKQKFKDVVEQIEHNAIYKSYESYKQRLDLTLDRKTASPLLFVGGKTGFGKTYAALAACKKRGLGVLPSRPANPHAFVQMLFEASICKIKVILLDDVGSLLTSAQTAELIKMGWDRKRTITWRNLNTRRPDTFKIKAALIWISNANLEKDVPRAMQANLDALKSRGGHQICIDGTDQEMFDYTVWLGTVGGMLKDQHISIESSVKAINFFNEHRNRLREISPRSLGFIAKEIHRGVSQQSLVAGYLTNEPVRNISGFDRLELNLPDKVWKESSSAVGNEFCQTYHDQVVVDDAPKFKHYRLQEDGRFMKVEGVSLCE